MPDLPSGTVTFLFTDIEGSMRRWEEHTVAMQAALAQHDALLRAVVEGHGGHVFKTVGDAVYAVFAAAPAAVAAALAGQRALQAHRWAEEIGMLQVRMALHSGTVESREGDYFGLPLNRVARLLSAGYGGQVLLSAATYELVRDHLPEAASLRDLGEHRLKDLIRPEYIYQLEAPALPAEFPLLKTLDSRANNLPAQQSAFIGRERELDVVRTLVHRSDVRMVTLTGPGGTGKTRLALQVAADLLDDFAQGVYFVPLAPVSDPALVIATVAQVLGLHESGNQPLQEILLDYLGDKELLLVLDNFEQVVAAAPVVSTLLAAAPRVKVVVTSRTVLRVYGEQEFAVPPLTLPVLRHLPSMDVLSQYEAVALFIQRAQLAKADFAMTNENAPAVAEICVRLDGLPLAIELAAARIKLLPPQALLPRLESRLKVLTGGARDLPARQQTLRGAIDWSYNLLNPGEQTLFAWLSVFVGGCTLEAVEDVCARAGGLPDDILDGVSSLVDKSLLCQEEDPATGEPRFTMLETIREYAQERLGQSGTEDAVGAAQAQHYLALAEDAAPHLSGAAQGMWLERLEQEHDNLRAALRWAQKGEARREVGLRIAAAIWQFWQVRGYLSEGSSWLEGAISLDGTGAKEPPRGSAAVRAKALNGAGNLAWRQGDYARATVLHEESLSLRREQGDRRGIASSLNNLGLVVQAQGDYRRATVLYEESVALYRELGFKEGIAAALGNLGNVVDAQGDFARATTLHEENLALKRELGDTWGIANTINNLGILAEQQGDYARATVLHEESLALFQELGDAWGSANALFSLGNVVYRLGNYARARVLFEEGLALKRKVSDKRGISHGLENLGELAQQQGDYARARVLYEESLALKRKLGDKRDISSSLEGLACVASASGTVSENLERAARLLGAAATLRAAIGTPLPPSELPRYERTVAALRAVLDDATYEAAWGEGQVMTMEQAISIALNEGA